MRQAPQGGFLDGLLTGALGTAVLGAGLLYVLDLGRFVTIAERQAPALRELLVWSERNLGLSLPVFALVLLLFVHSLLALGRRLRARAPVEQVAQAEHLADTWTALFFGVGVIWTAIGMRAALIFALGDPATVQSAGAFTLLQRMVDGGILIALSTTIFGGVGGYLMRIAKTVTLGAELKRYYREHGNAQGAEIHATLEVIERHLRLLLKEPAPAPAGRHRDERAAVV